MLSSIALRTPPVGRGGARRIRTDDILLAKQALYQLSYGPSPPCGELLKPRRAGSDAFRICRRLVGPIRLELMTSRLSSVRSNQLSYGPIGRIDQILDPKAKTRSWARDRLLDLVGR